MSENITNQFIEELYQLSRSNITENTKHQVQRCLLDYLGATLAGSRMIREKGNNFLKSIRSNEGSCNIIGFSRKASIHQAAFLNGFSSHVAEMDDGYRYGSVHPGVAVFSALLPLSEQEQLETNDFIRGVVVGYEAILRLSRAMQPALINRGYHATGLCGTIGSAMATAAALGFSYKQMKAAISAAATSAAGLLRVIQDGSELKPLNAAHAASSGLTAAFLSRAGFEGPENILGDHNGFLEIKALDYNEAHLLKDKNAKPGVFDIYVKPYAACRHSHPAIESALYIKNKYNINPNDVKKIIVETYKWAVILHDHTEISGVTAAKMSTPYSLAIALIDNQASVKQFMPDKIAQKNVIKLTKKVKVVEKQELTNLVPSTRAAIVEITTKTGARYSKRVDLPKGEPETSLSDDELTEKFYTLSRFGGLTLNLSKSIVNHVFNLEQGIKPLIKIL